MIYTSVLLGTREKIEMLVINPFIYIVHNLLSLISSLAQYSHPPVSIMASHYDYSVDDHKMIPVYDYTNICPGHPLYHTNYSPIMVEFKLYLDKYGIEYPKKKDGYPHMTYNVNKIHKIKFDHIKMQQSWSSMREPLTKSTKGSDHNRRERTIYTKLDDNVHKCTVQQKIQKYECVICMQEQDTNICLLECKHAFCTKCFAIHFRYNNCCPLCRKEVCSMPKPEKETMPEESMFQIIHNEYQNNYPERDDLSLRQYISGKLEQHRTGCNEEVLLNDIEKEVMEFGQDVAQRIIEWYDE